MPFSLNYKDYLSNAQGLNASENATTPMSEQEWNAIPDDQKWGLLGYGNQGISVNKFDPRYQGLLADGVSGGDNQSINVMPGKMTSNTNNYGVQRFNDPTQVQQRDGYYASPNSNTTADAQKQGGLNDKQWGILAATLLGGGAALGGAMGAGAAGAGAAGEFVGPSAGLMNFGLDSSLPALGATEIGGLEGGSLIGGASGGGGLLGGGVDIPGPMDALTPTNVGNLGPGYTGSNTLLQNVMQGNLGEVPGQLGSWAMKNPLQAYGAAQTIGGLFNHGGSNSGGSSGSSGSKSAGGAGTGAKIERPQYTPNPYLIAQLRQGGYSV